jgi:hypothetical protein
MSTAETQPDLPKIIKRLELIKNLISLEEEDEIVLQVKKLKQFSLNGELQNIIKLLEQKSYSEAIVSLEAFMNKHYQLSFYLDPEIDALKLEAKSLETQINILSNQKAELEKLVHEFGVRHSKELGELIIKILKYRKEKAKGSPQEEEAAQDYNRYNKEYEITKDQEIATLTEEEQKELKEKYRKASKLCHPDVMSEEQKELATKLFAELNAANERNDLQRVREILKDLEKGNLFVSKSDAINEKQLLKAAIEKLRLRIKELAQQLQSIKESKTYKTITGIDNWDEYFTNTKQQLQQQLDVLEN